MVNFDKYYNSGWGLSRHGFEKLYELLEMLKIDSNVVEFGSGISTQFFLDYMNIKNINLFSYENDLEYGFQGDKSNIKFIKTDLITCSDSDFKKQFDSKSYNRNFYIKKLEKPTTRQKNVFYDIGDELPSNIGLVLLDGPNGNGRSISFLHLKDRMKKDSYIFIDDYSHYPFMDYCKKIFDISVVYTHNGVSGEKWINGGDFTIVKIN